MTNTGIQATVVRTGRGMSITGTRITLYDIMAYLKADVPLTLIQQWLNLNDTQISDALQYLMDHHDEAEAEYQLVMRQGEEIRAYWDEHNRELLAEIATLPSKPGSDAVIAKLRARKAELGLE